MKKSKPYKMEVELVCPKCKVEIKSMKHLTKPFKFRWICECGENVSKQKLTQLANMIAKELNISDEKELVKHLPIF
jgi:hypothetical protein